MKLPVTFLLAVFAAAASETPVEQIFNGKLTSVERANACFQLRGNTQPEVIAALSRALEDPDLLSCAAANLRMAGAVEQLQRALTNSNFQVRAAAARELGMLRRPELLELLSSAAQDENMLVATNALTGLCEYDDPRVVPYLIALARKGGITGDMALDRLSQLDPAQALSVARGLLASPQVPDELYALRIIGSAGDASDLPELKRLAGEHTETLAQRDRGFGLMPGINLARAARAAVLTIEERMK